jgi:hypothetical protein
LEEFGIWNPRRVRQVVTQHLRRVHERRMKDLGLDPVGWEPWYGYLRGLVLPLLEFLVDDPEGARRLLSMSLSPDGFETFCKRGEAILGDPESFQAAIRAVQQAETLEDRWSIALTALRWVDVEDNVREMIRAADQGGNAWLRRFRNTLVELAERQTAIVQWDLRHRYAGMDGFVLLHGSRQRLFSNGIHDVGDSFCFTWDRFLAHDESFGSAQIVVVKIPFSRVINTSWVLSHWFSVAELSISGGPIEVLATLDPGEGTIDAVPTELSYRDSAQWATPPSRQWVYQGNTVPAWVTNVDQRVEPELDDLEREPLPLEWRVTKRHTLACMRIERISTPAKKPETGSILVFTEPETFAFVPFAVRWGWMVVVASDSPEADAISALLAALPRRVQGRYAVGTEAAAVFLNGFSTHRPVPIRTREEASQRIGLPPAQEDWPELLTSAAEAIQQYVITYRTVRTSA